MCERKRTLSTDDGTRTFQYSYRNELKTATRKADGRLLSQYWYYPDSRLYKRSYTTLLLERETFDDLPLDHFGDATWFKDENSTWTFDAGKAWSADSNGAPQLTRHIGAERTGIVVAGLVQSVSGASDEIGGVGVSLDLSGGAVDPDLTYVVVHRYVAPNNTFRVYRIQNNAREYVGYNYGASSWLDVSQPYNLLVRAVLTDADATIHAAPPADPVFSPRTAPVPCGSASRNRRSRSRSCGWCVRWRTPARRRRRSRGRRRPAACGRGRKRARR
ncbi:MAG: hypothetical protein HY719_02175 [Planctomycetes bacterium]|nr:hypothetical protein [Planctomycetota bacterium]